MYQYQIQNCNQDRLNEEIKMLTAYTENRKIKGFSYTIEKKEDSEMISVSITVLEKENEH